MSAAQVADGAHQEPQEVVRKYIRGQILLAVFVLSFPFLPFISYSITGRAILAGQYALIAISLVVLTGWVGQISLGHGALVGVGAYFTGIATGGWGLGFPLNILVGAGAGALTAALLGTVALRVRGLYLAVATLIFSWTADAFLFQQEWLTKHSSIEVKPIGEPGGYPTLDFTSRKTFYYAVWAAVILVIFLMTNLRDRKIGRAFFAIRGSEMAAASLGIDVVRTKLTAFAVSGAVAGVAGSMIIVGAQVVTTDQFDLGKGLFFLSIAVVGGLTSLPGAVAGGVLFAGLEEVFFKYPVVGEYLQIISACLLALVLLLYPGGLAALGPALAQRARPIIADARRRLVERLPDNFRPRFLQPAADRAPNPEGEQLALLEDVTQVEALRRRMRGRSSGGWRPRLPEQPPTWLKPVLDRIRGPLDRFQASQAARRQVKELGTAQLDFAKALGREPEELPEEHYEPEPAPSTANGNGSGGEASHMRWEDMEFEPPFGPKDSRKKRKPLVEARDVVVRFGGLTAVNGFSMQVREGEIVGLIGPNGAGKTTSFNSIAGFNTPAEGSIHIHGLEVTSFPVHLRSRLGVARTFQAIQLFPQLNVFDNLLVATFLADTTSIFGCMFNSARSLQSELNARERVLEVIELLGLEDVAARTVADLPFGVLRMVEIARALVTGAPVMMLDEPASGLDEVETARLSQLIRFIRSLGVTILLIEHDVKMVTSISDYMYVIDQGTPIAEGTPDEVQRNPVVIAAYLGSSGDDEASSDDPAAATASSR